MTRTPTTYAEWLATLPERVRAVAERYPSTTADGETLVCYRSTQDPRYHYTIGSYCESKPERHLPLPLPPGDANARARARLDAPGRCHAWPGARTVDPVRVRSLGVAVRRTEAGDASAHEAHELDAMSEADEKMVADLVAVALTRLHDVSPPRRLAILGALLENACRRVSKHRLQACLYLIKLEVHALEKLIEGMS